MKTIKNNREKRNHKSVHEMDKIEDEICSNHAKQSINESSVPLFFDGLSPYVQIIRPSRTSLSYERIE